MIFLRACMALRLRFTEGFSKCCRFRSSVKIPDFSTLRLKRRKAFSKLSSSRTCTTGIDTHLFSLARIEAPPVLRGARRANFAQIGGKVKPLQAALRREGTGGAGWGWGADCGSRASKSVR